MNWVLRLNSIQHAETYQGLGACESPRWDASVACRRRARGRSPKQSWECASTPAAAEGAGDGPGLLFGGGGRAEGRRRSHLGLCMATRSRWSDLLVKSVNRRDPGCEFPRAECRAWRSQSSDGRRRAGLARSEAGVWQYRLCK